MAIDYKSIQKYISEPRLQKYEQVSLSDKRKTLKLYQTNLRISQAFYPILSLFEVVLRNAINEELVIFFHDPNWLKNQVNGFMSDPSLKYYHKKKNKWLQNEFLKNSALEAIKKSGYSTLHHKVIAELKFGYWTALFDPTNSKILAGRPMRIFSSLPTGTSRSNVFDKIKRIRDFRNRVYHNEPIIFVKNPTTHLPTVDLKSCMKIYKDIVEIFDWLNLDFKNWTKRIDNVPFGIERGNCMVKHYPSKTYYSKRILLGILHYKSKYFDRLYL